MHTLKGWILWYVKGFLEAYNPWKDLSISGLPSYPWGAVLQDVPSYPYTAGLQLQPPPP